MIGLLINGFQVRVLVGALTEPLPYEGVRGFCAVKLPIRDQINPTPLPCTASKRNVVAE
jgi:hypothetical protein